MPCILDGYFLVCLEHCISEGGVYGAALQLAFSAC